MGKKLASRKFWVCLAGFVTALCTAFGVDTLTTGQICAVLGALGTLIAYIIAEGYVDAKHQNESKSGEESNEKE